MGTDDSIYNKMVEYAKGKEEFLSKNGKPILDFPLHIPCGISIVEFLEDTFEKYKKLIRVSNFHVDDKTVSIASRACDDILNKIIRRYLNGDIAGAYSSLNNLMKSYGDITQYCT